MRNVERRSVSVWKPGQRLQAGGPAQDLGMENSSEKESVVLSPAPAHSDAGIPPGSSHQGQIATERLQQQQHLSPENNKRPPGLRHNQTVNYQTIPVRLPSGSASELVWAGARMERCRRQDSVVVEEEPEEPDRLSRCGQCPVLWLVAFALPDSLLDVHEKIVIVLLLQPCSLLPRLRPLRQIAGCHFRILHFGVALFSPRVRAEGC